MEVLITYGSQSLTIVKIVNDAIPTTGYQYVKDGGSELKNAIKILTGPQGENLNDQLKTSYLKWSKSLVLMRQDLTEKTASFSGSLKFRSEAKDFYTVAHKLFEYTQTSSHKANIEKALQDIMSRQGPDVFESMWRDENQLRPIEEVPLTMIPHPSNHPNHANLSRQDMPLEESTSSQYASIEALVHPPAAYHPHHSTRC